MKRFSSVTVAAWTLNAQGNWCHLGLTDVFQFLLSILLQQQLAAVCLNDEAYWLFYVSSHTQRSLDETRAGGVYNSILFLFWFLCGLKRGGRGIVAGGESVRAEFSGRQWTPLWDIAFPRGSYSLEGNGDSLSLGLDLQFVSACQEQQITALWPSELRAELSPEKWREEGRKKEWDSYAEWHTRTPKAWSVGCNDVSQYRL